MQRTSHDRMPCLDGLRGLAAIMVLFGHAREFNLPSIIHPSARDYGVLIFFALSGFLMGELYLTREFNRREAVTYLAARIARIVPFYYLLLVLSFFIYQFVDPNFTYSISLSQFARLLTFNGSVSVFWSIGPEFQFYFVFVLLWYVYHRLNNQVVFTVIAVAASGACVMTIKCWPGILLPSKFHLFACGMLFALLRKQEFSKSLISQVLVPLQVVCVTGLVLVLMSGSLSDFLGGGPVHQNDPTFSAFYGSVARTLFAGLLVFSLSYDNRITRLIFANRLASLLGRASFSIYLLHVPIFYLLGMLPYGDGLEYPTCTTCVFAACSIAVSTMTYRFIEQPTRVVVRDKIMQAWSGISQWSPGQVSVVGGKAASVSGAGPDDHPTRLASAQ